MPLEEEREVEVIRLPAWQQDFVDQIRNGHAVPVISNKVVVDFLFGDYRELVRKYAARIQYPLSDHDDLLQMAKFKRFTDEGMISDRVLKSDYINFLKNRLFYRARADGVPDTILGAVEKKFDRLKFSEFSSQLGYPSFDEAPDNPLLMLAELAIYLTTGQHNLIEMALKVAGKAPQTEICRWWHSTESENLPLVDHEFEPSVERPLVYHLHGLDDYPESLVLTEDDYLQFLIAISKGRGQSTDPINHYVRRAIASSALILLGYELRSWDFKALFWGLIKPKEKRINKSGVFIQVEPTEIEKKYFKKYLWDEIECQIHWGEIEEYARFLRNSLR